MKEKGILFKTEMVQAALENRKFCTRRLSGLEEINKNPNEWELMGFGEFNSKFMFVNKRHGRAVYVKPRYQVGDLAYVKEPHRISHHRDGNDCVCYKADGRCQCGKKDLLIPETVKWKSSMFMRKEYARLFLPVTSVSAGRLQDITEEDAIKEGAIGIDSFISLWHSINGPYSWAINPWTIRYGWDEIRRGQK